MIFYVGASLDFFELVVNSVNSDSSAILWISDACLRSIKKPDVLNQALNGLELYFS
jgi:hypothetical protein